MPAGQLISIARTLRREVDRLTFAHPVTHVYNPLVYAWEAHREYLRRFGAGTREVVLVGMNPGPWGMVQTGVPFGDPEMVQEWMGIRARIRKPQDEHPRRPVHGFLGHRREVSGRRLWGWARDRHGRAESFFSRFFVLNYCPLSFMEAGGRNRTPDRLPAEEKEPLLDACDRALRRSLDSLQPRFVVGIGTFAYHRSAAILDSGGAVLGMAPHPSPANPGANRGWDRQMDRALQRLGVPGSASRR